MRNIYKFGDIPVEILYRGTYFGEISKEYLAEGETPRFSILATDEDLDYELKMSEDDIEYGKPYLEYIALYRKFCEKAVDYGVFLCHGSVISFDGDAYMFTAVSGTGKSTHTRLWREKFGDRVQMINDDKPLLRVKEDGIYAYGTPWDGKHHLSSNINAKLKGICFLHQAKENSIRPAQKDEILPLIMNQIYRPRNTEGVIKTMDFVEKLINQVPMYIFGCNISEEAVDTAYQTIVK